MRRWFSTHVKRHMIRPIIYKATSRFAYLLCIALIWDRFINQGKQPIGLSLAFGLIAIGFLLAWWLAYLRMDGVSIPRLPARHKKKKKIDSLFGDMIDYVDEKPVDFEELEEDEKCLCLLLSDAVCSVIFLVLSLI